MWIAIALAAGAGLGYAYGRDMFTFGGVFARLRDLVGKLRSGSK
jgi:hypothetical protein